MAKWIPSLDDRSGPKYLRIADALAEDVYAGRIAVGERLPTHRDLAWRLGVTVGTVSRAYAEAERRGLVVGEVGRGSYVRAGARSTATLAMPEQDLGNKIELGINRPPSGTADREFSEAMRNLSQSDRLGELLTYQPHTGRWEHRIAGAAWVARRGLIVGPERVLVTSGAEHAIAATLMAFCDPGDPVLVEELTWSGTRALASLLRLSLRGVTMDQEGVIPDAFEAAAKSTGARIFYSTPTIHNPTTRTMSERRRREIADIARNHGIMIVEDDVHGFLDPNAPPALSSFAPERSIYITATSKTLAPSLRVGFAAVPEDRIGRFSAAARATNWMAPPLMAEIVTRWIADGTADRLTERVRVETRARQEIAANVLAGFQFAANPWGSHLWLELPEPWRVQDVVTSANARGVSLTSTELFVPGRQETPHAIRVAVTAPKSREELATGLGILRDILRRHPEPCLAVA